MNFTNFNITNKKSKKRIIYYSLIKIAKITKIFFTKKKGEEVFEKC